MDKDFENCFSAEGRKDGRGWWAWVTVSFALFAALRALYWFSIDEKPFSDMADYYAIAKRVWQSFSFEHNYFWKSYKPPGMPLLAAPIVGPFDGDVGLWIWRVILAAATFLGALFLASQLAHVCRSRWIAVGFLIIVSISKSSIFWSYRFSTESPTEAVTYVAIALFLWFVRDVRERTVWHAGLLGAVCIWLALIRPNMMPVFGIVPVGIALRWLTRYPKSYSRMTAHVVAFTMGVMVLWTPWLCRGLHLYGELVPFSTQGPYSFLWEVDGFHYDDPELGRRNVNADILQAEAANRFSTDKQAANLASLAGKQWLQQYGYTRYAWLVLRRLGVMIRIRDISLAKTPRPVILFSPIDEFLLDKSFATVSFAVLGLLAGAFVFGLDFIIFGAFVTFPVLLSACFMGEPRMLEPMLPLVFFAALIGFLLPLRLLRRLRRKGRSLVDGV